MEIIKAVYELSQQYHCTMSQIALAWQWAKGVASPIIGSTKVTHIKEAVEALQITLSPQDVMRLEACYVPHPIVGAIDKNPDAGVVLLDNKK